MLTKNALNKIINCFENGNIPHAIARTTYPKYDVPQNKWSFFNRTLCKLQGTYDARGFKQWEKSGRSIKDGSKSIIILAPKYKIIRDTITDEETGEKKEIKSQVLEGFRPINVFRVEDTYGRELDYEKIELQQFPFLEVAEKWGIEVNAVPFESLYGCYYLDKPRIDIATSSEKTFFHELSHAAHDRILKRKGGRLKAGQNHIQEIIAELCAAALGYIAGKKIPETIGNSYEYIKRYSRSKNPVNTCIHVLSECGNVIDEILTAAEKEKYKIEA